MTKSKGVPRREVMEKPKEVKPYPISGNEVREVVITSKGVKIEDRSFGSRVQIWINDVPAITFKQDEYHIQKNWKMSLRANRYCGEAVLLMTDETTGKVKEVKQSYQYDNAETARAVFTILAKYN